ncbi:MAG: hypothetical protein N4A35_10145 [Flavobacteriales bacterium]|jgi:hypothetical protein|nr:hypothetical protein [Flavobacteriales bacterium]
MTKNIDELIVLLEEAIQNLEDEGNGYSDHFINLDAFINAIKKSKKTLLVGDFSVIKDLELWFSPTSDWDDFNGDEDLGNQIFSIILDNQI